METGKTIGKAKTVSYTDKKLNTGETYSYVVVAYYKEGKVTKAISNGASVEMQIAPPTNVKSGIEWLQSKSDLEQKCLCEEV